MNNDDDNRSASAIKTDRQAEMLMEKREHVLWFYLVILILVEGTIYFYDIASWIGIVFAIAWIGMFLGNELKLIYHELIELNDQLSGRKDEFKRNISKDE